MGLARIPLSNEGMCVWAVFREVKPSLGHTNQLHTKAWPGRLWTGASEESNSEHLLYHGSLLSAPSAGPYPEQGHCLPSPIDQPVLNVKPHSSHCSARSPPLAPSLARDLLSGDTTALMTRFGSCSMGLLGLGRWKLWISSWKPQEFGLLEQSVKSPGTTPLVVGAPPRPHSCLVWVASIEGDAQWRAALKTVMLVVDSPRTEPYSQDGAPGRDYLQAVEGSECRVRSPLQDSALDLIFT
ncbi:hypothetical protein JOB18_022241 [Solea senegalensis]|uniref:Uncharacterized protein n=1 Tax=Solea senegalensis TaxID=28829 RepID=A0AAV6T748_SOLSE|nr:hypothetical protein JOB18_022241 [Solea senegalensis]